MTSNEPPNKKPKSIGDKSLEEIQSILECPVCYQTPKNPEKIHICSNNHIVCDTCKSRIDKCPTCRSKKFQGKNSLLQKLLSALPKICQFKDEGCEVEFEPKNGDDLENHLKICQHRQIDCVYNDCDLKVSFLNLKKHMEENHLLNFIDNYYKIIVKPEDFTDDCSWFPSFMKFDDKIFYVQVFTEENQMSLQCYFHGTEAESRKYFFEMFVENDPSSRHELRVNFSGEVISVDIPNASRFDINDSTFNISNQMAKWLWNKDKELISFKITIKHV